MVKIIKGKFTTDKLRYKLIKSYDGCYKVWDFDAGRAGDYVPSALFLDRDFDLAWNYVLLLNNGYF